MALNRYTAPVLASLALACSGDSLVCGAKTHAQDGMCVPDDPGGGGTVTIVNTTPVTETITVEDSDLDPGRFLPPIKQLQYIVDDDGAIGTAGSAQTHKHIDEVRYRASDERLFYCSYTFGVLDVSDPADVESLAQGFEWDLPSPVDRATGCLHLDWDDADPDIVYVSHRGNVDFHPHLSVVDLGTFAPDPYYPDETELAPVLAPSLFEDGVSYEGLDAENGFLYVALHAGGVGVFQRDPATNELSRVGGNDSIVPNAYDIEVVGNLAYVVDEQAGLFVLDVTDPNDITEVSRLFVGGVDRDLQVDGNYAYIAAGGAGLVIVDISDPASPVVVSTTNTYGTATRVGYNGDRVSVAAWNDTRVYDVSDRSQPQIIGAARLERPKSYAGDDDQDRPDPTSRTLGTDLYGDTLFVGDWMTPYTFTINADRQAPYLVLPEDLFYMGVGTVDVGASGTFALRVENDGTADLTVYDIWATHPAFEITPEQALIPPGGEAIFTITYTATSIEEEHAIVNIFSDDPNQPIRKGYVVGNAEGIGIGDAFPVTSGTDVNTLAEWSSDQLAGQVTLLAYFATF
jgi:hypothetical protein